MDIKFLQFFGCIMKIAVMSKSGAREFNYDEPWICISISSDPTQFPELHEENLAGVLRLCFLDVDLHRNSGMTEEQGLQALEFVDSHIATAKFLLVHCEMGMSRSPGIAAALFKVFTGQNDQFWFERYTPNTRCYNTVLKVAQADDRFNQFLTS